MVSLHLVQKSLQKIPDGEIQNFLKGKNYTNILNTHNIIYNSIYIYIFYINIPIQHTVNITIFLLFFMYLMESFADEFNEFQLNKIIKMLIGRV